MRSMLCFVYQLPERSETMRKCKRCHAPDKLNPLGLCAPCAAYIKEDIKAKQARINAIYASFPDTEGQLEDVQKKALLNETEELFEVLDKYKGFGCPVDDYLTPARKILYFLDTDKSVTRRLFSSLFLRKAKSVAIWLAILIVVAVPIFHLLLFVQGMANGDVSPAGATPIENGSSAEEAFNGAFPGVQDDMLPLPDPGAESPSLEASVPLPIPFQTFLASLSQTYSLADIQEAGSDPAGPDGLIRRYYVLNGGYTLSLQYQPETDALYTVSLVCPPNGESSSAAAIIQALQETPLEEGALDALLKPLFSQPDPDALSQPVIEGDLQYTVETAESGLTLHIASASVPADPNPPADVPPADTPDDSPSGDVPDAAPFAEEPPASAILPSAI